MSTSSSRSDDIIGVDVTQRNRIRVFRLQGAREHPNSHLGTPFCKSLNEASLITVHSNIRRSFFLFSPLPLRSVSEIRPSPTRVAPRARDEHKGDVAHILPAGTLRRAAPLLRRVGWFSPPASPPSGRLSSIRHYPSSVSMSRTMIARPRSSIVHRHVSRLWSPEGQCSRGCLVVALRLRNLMNKGLRLSELLPPAAPSDETDLHAAASK